MAGDIVTCSSRPEWLPLLHNIAMLHATVRPRKEAYPQAWAKEYSWRHTHLMVSNCAVTQCYTMLHNATRWFVFVTDIELLNHVHVCKCTLLQTWADSKNMRVVLPMNFWCGNQLQVLLLYVKERSNWPGSSVSCSHNTEQLEFGQWSRGHWCTISRHMQLNSLSGWISCRPILISSLSRWFSTSEDSLHTLQNPKPPLPTGHSVLCGKGVLFLRGGAARGQWSETHLVEWNQAPNQWGLSLCLS